MNTLNLTVEELVNGVEEALQHWLDIHLDADKWAETWVIDDVAYTFQCCDGIIKNNYFEFDWKAEVLKVWVNENYKLFSECHNCGMIDDSGEEYCDCGRKMRPARKYRVLDYYESCLDDESLINIVGEWELMEALKKGFKVYRKGVKYLVDEVVPDIRAALRSLRKARTIESLMTSLTWALHVCHVNGDVVKDYGNIDYKTVCALQQNGLADYFSVEEFDEYLKENR